MSNGTPFALKFYGDYKKRDLRFFKTRRSENTQQEKNMQSNITSHNLLNLFDSLTEKEKAEVAAAIIKKTAMPELPDLSDNDFNMIDKELFLNLDNEEVYNV